MMPWLTNTTCSSLVHSWHALSDNGVRETRKKLQPAQSHSGPTFRFRDSFRSVRALLDAATVRDQMSLVRWLPDT